MDKLDVKVYRAAIERNSGLHREEMLKIIDECQRLQERETASAVVIAIPASVLQSVRSNPNAYSDVTALRGRTG